LPPGLAQITRSGAFYGHPHASGRDSRSGPHHEAPHDPQQGAKLQDAVSKAGERVDSHKLDHAASPSLCVIIELIRLIAHFEVNSVFIALWLSFTFRVGEAVVATSKNPAVRSSSKTAVLACGRCVWLHSIENHVE
jgi:hypothetical protein